MGAAGLAWDQTTTALFRQGFGGAALATSLGLR